jgi:hypothetical protein
MHGVHSPGLAAFKSTGLPEVSIPPPPASVNRFEIASRGISTSFLPFPSVGNPLGYFIPWQELVYNLKYPKTQQQSHSLASSSQAKTITNI